ncbi:hypothetical protein BGZ73_004436 [Actinomortierella ambigua]|nr:hypothetical protein BGZ73_004436 [Actinomortierella ambigua]
MVATMVLAVAVGRRVTEHIYVMRFDAYRAQTWPISDTGMLSYWMFGYLAHQYAVGICVKIELTRLHYSDAGNASDIGSRTFIAFFLQQQSSPDEWAVSQWLKRASWTNPGRAAMGSRLCFAQTVPKPSSPFTPQLQHHIMAPNKRAIASSNQGNFITNFIRSEITAPEKRAGNTSIAISVTVFGLAVTFLRSLGDMLGV